MSIEKIRKIAEEVAQELGLTVYGCSFTDNEDGRVLEIEIDCPGFIDLDGITAFTEKVNPLLDAVPELDFPYTLDCHSADPEREITSEDLSLYQGAYVEAVDGRGISYIGTLSVSDDDTVIQSFIKGRPKKQTIKRDDIKKITLRIKI